MINKEIVKRKIKYTESYLAEMQEVISADTAYILKNFRDIRTLERDFQLIIDEIIDINLHLIKELQIMPPDDFQSSFETLAEKSRIFPPAFAVKIAPSVGLRNKLVHRYEKVDQKFFVEQVKKNYRDFIEYLKYINEFLNNL